ncbi:unnamed protein product [Rotaria magnacalcarata]|uniref:NAD(P)(+)--arginine ADP-ribosyltransferase n=1 Tax=Rotaria magnacalcarata TaxID=392030 RepID=A0A819JLF4_9BILA|nr:unnamed protein product [Rotaria magnacalcarata]
MAIVYQSDTFNNRRFLDVGEEHLKALLPLRGYATQPLVTLEEAVVLLTNILHDVDARVWTAMNRSKYPLEGLTQDESAAIVLYTIQWDRDHPSLYSVLNRTLRTEDRDKVVPWFPYLKLTLTALYKLPSIQRTVWRGVRADLDFQYEVRDHITWWAFSSCTTAVNVLEKPNFLGKSGVRTLFVIECMQGKNIGHHSYYRTEQEILLLPCSYFEVIGKLKQNDGLTIIHLREMCPPIMLLEPPFPISGNLPELDVATSNRMTPISPGVTDLSLVKRQINDQDMELVALVVVHVCQVTHDQLYSMNLTYLILIFIGTQALKILNLSGNQIGATGAQHLADALKNNEMLTTLNIGDNYIGDNGAQHIADVLHQNKTLTTVVLKNNDIGDEGTEELAEALVHNETLTTLDLHVKPNISTNPIWAQNGVTVAGGNGQGDATNQLHRPWGIFVDDDQTVIITDCRNHRIVQWKKGDTTSGQIVAGGNSQGNRLDQLDRPTDVLIDKETDSLIICELGNRRVVRWSRHSGTTQGEILIENIDCVGLVMDHQRYLYVSDIAKHEVRRYQLGDKNGTLVAGGNGRGDDLNQLNVPTYLFVDRQQNVYVSDRFNHRVMKWNKGVKEGIVAVGDQSEGNALTQLNRPHGLFVDTLGTLYVADSGNDRVMRWAQGEKQGTVIVGENGRGARANQIDLPTGLSFDRHGNLYVVDQRNHRVQRFSLDYNLA